MLFLTCCVSLLSWYPLSTESFNSTSNTGSNAMENLELILDRAKNTPGHPDWYCRIGTISCFHIPERKLKYDRRLSHIPCLGQKLYHLQLYAISLFMFHFCHPVEWRLIFAGGDVFASPSVQNLLSAAHFCCFTGVDRYSWHAIRCSYRLFATVLNGTYVW